ncbi:MAG: hypothetical protein WBC34_06080, partial [Thiofilum sp.]
MPIPFIIGAAVAAAAGFGAKKAYDGYQDKSEAERIAANAEQSYKQAKADLDSVNDEVSKRLESLGELQLEIGSKFDNFDKLIKEILESNDFQHTNIHFNIPKHKLDKIREVAFTATDYLKTVVAGGASGAAAGFAVYGGVMTLAAASTGTPIAALSGAAAYNATMAAIGGGSLATGGWGMAGGAMVLGAAVVAPILAIAGWAYAFHGAKALENAHKYQAEVASILLKMSKANAHLLKVDEYATRMETSLLKMDEVFQLYFDKLVELNAYIKVGNKDAAKNLIGAAQFYIENGIALAAIMASIISQPLFKVKKDTEGKV